MIKNSPVPVLSALAIVLLAPFAKLLFFSEGLVAGHPHCDGMSMFYYIMHFTGQCWREGVVPFWNPYLMLGYPFLGEGQAAAFHPLTALFVFLPTGVAYNWSVALAFLFSGLSFYGYSRAAGTGWKAAFCGTLAWNFSSVLIPRVYCGGYSMYLAVTLIPTLFFLWEKWRETRNPLWLPAVSAAYGIMILAGHPQTTYYASLFLLLYALWQMTCAALDRESPGEIARVIFGFGLFILLGIGIGAIQLSPSADYAAESFRKKSGFDYCASFSFAPENIITLLCPGFFGNGLGKYWGRNYPWEMTLYLGVPPLIAAITGWFAAPRRARWPLGGCAAVFLLLGLGRHTPLFQCLYGFFPFFDTFRGTSKFGIMFLFCLCALSAFGFEKWFAPQEEEIRDVPLGKGKPSLPILAGFAGATLLLLTVIAFNAFLTAGYESPDSPWRNLILWRYAQGETYLGKFNVNKFADIVEAGIQAAAQLMRAAFLLLLTLFALLAAWKRPFWSKRFLFPSVLIILLADFSTFLPSWWQTFPASMTVHSAGILKAIPPSIVPARSFGDNGPLNASILYRLSNVGGYTGNTLPRFNHFINRSQKLPLFNSQASAQVKEWHPVFRMLGLQYMILGKTEITPDMKPLARGQDGGVLVEYASSSRSPRVFLAATPKIRANLQESFDYIFDDNTDLLASPAVEISTGTLSASMPADFLAAAPLADGETASITAFSPNRVELRVHAARPRLLVLDEMYYKDWVARVNGKETPVYPANFIFRGVAVPAGDSTVVFTYESPAFRKGAAISAVALPATLALLGWSLRASSRKKQKQEAVS